MDTSCYFHNVSRFPSVQVFIYIFLISYLFRRCNQPCFHLPIRMLVVRLFCQSVILSYLSLIIGSFTILVRNGSRMYLTILKSLPTHTNKYIHALNTYILELTKLLLSKECTFISRLHTDTNKEELIVARGDVLAIHHTQLVSNCISLAGSVRIMSFVWGVYESVLFSSNFTTKARGSRRFPFAAIKLTHQKNRKGGKMAT